MNLHRTTLPIAPSRKLYAELRELVRTLRITELTLAEKLADAERTRAYLHLSTDMRGYLEGLGLKRGKGRDLLRIGRKLPELPILRAAMADESVPWTAAREVVKVAIPNTEEGWVRLAEKWSVKNLTAAVLNAAPGDEAPDSLEVPIVTTAIFRFEVSAEDAELVRKAMALIRFAAPEDGPEPTTGELLVEMAAAVVAEKAPEQNIPAERFQKVIRVCPSCDCAEMAGTTEDENVEVSHVVQEMMNCDSQVIDLRPGADGRMNRTVSPRIRRIVMDRDNYRCAVPGCGNSLRVDVHHVVHREHGGSHTVGNLISCCAGCHRRIHAGYLTVEATRSGGFSFDWPMGDRSCVTSFGSG